VRTNATTCDRLRSGEDAQYQKKQAPVQFGETGAARVLFFIKTNSLSGSTMHRYLFFFAFCAFRFSLGLSLDFFRFSFLPLSLLPPLSPISVPPNSKELLIGNRRSVVATPPGPTQPLSYHKSLPPASRRRLARWATSSSPTSGTFSSSE